MTEKQSWTKQGEGWWALFHASRDKHMSDEAFRVLGLVVNAAKVAGDNTCRLSNAEIGKRMTPQREAGVIQEHLKALSAQGYLAWTGHGASRELTAR